MAVTHPPNSHTPAAPHASQPTHPPPPPPPLCTPPLRQDRASAAVVAELAAARCIADDARHELAVMSEKVAQPLGCPRPSTPCPWRASEPQAVPRFFFPPRSRPPCVLDDPPPKILQYRGALARISLLATRLGPSDGWPHVDAGTGHRFVAGDGLLGQGPPRSRDGSPSACSCCWSRLWCGSCSGWLPPPSVHACNP